jgi:hypothetical protein
MNPQASNINMLKQQMEQVNKALIPMLSIVNENIILAKEDAIKKGEEKEFKKTFVESGILTNFADIQTKLKEVNKW